MPEEDHRARRGPASGSAEGGPAPRRGADALADDIVRQLDLMRDECPPYARALRELRALVSGPTAARPLVLADVGAAAGLNLVSDRLPTQWTTRTGDALRVATRLDCRVRVGFDAAPLDVRFDEDVAWLRACVWPGQDARLAAFDHA